MFREKTQSDLIEIKINLYSIKDRKKFRSAYT